MQKEKVDGEKNNKDGKKPTSVDLLLIQRHILELQIIEQ